MKIKFNATHIESGEEYIYPEEGDVKLDPKEIVLEPDTYYMLVISYPLSTPAKFKINSGKRGISRGKLVSLICKYYHKIYEIEDGSTKIKPSKIPGMYNRNITDGKFGIWGHDIGDLILVDGEVSNNHMITLGVDS